MSSVSFNKNGIVSAGGDVIGANLIKGLYSCVTTSSTHTASNTTSLPDINDILVANRGKTLWFSYWYSAEGDRSTTTGRTSSDTLRNRYGAHLSFKYNKTDGTVSSQFYPCASSLELSGTGITVMSYQLPSDIGSIVNFSMAFQPFAGPADGNNATWYLKNFKLEIGDRATPWIPHEDDLGYPGNQFSFIETGNMMKIFDNHIETTEFIEY